MKSMMNFHIYVLSEKTFLLNEKSSVASSSSSFLKYIVSKKSRKYSKQMSNKKFTSSEFNIAELKLNWKNIMQNFTSGTHQAKKISDDHSKQDS